MVGGKILVDTPTFTVELCKKKAATVARLKKQKKLDLSLIKARFDVVTDADIALVILHPLCGQVIVHGFGELTFKDTEDPELIVQCATDIYETQRTNNGE